MKQYYNFKLLLTFCLSLGLSAAWGQITVIDYTGDYVTYTVPLGVSSINIEALGAQGASGDPGYVGGNGAKMSGDFDVTPGDELIIVVGGEGQGQSSNSNGGGGGGTFVVVNDPGGAYTIGSGPHAGTNVTPLIVAGGGGGTRTSVTANGNPGVTGNSGTSSSCSGASGGGSPVTAPEAGGVALCSSWGSGGGGFVGNGGNDGGNGQGGFAFLNGAAGGNIGSCGDAAEGGFGGGGQGRGCYGGGGGGGWSGGQGGRVEGGGGSYNIGIDPDNETGFQEGDGQVTIEVNCAGVELDVTAYSGCVGEEITVTGTSLTGGTITWDMGVLNGVPFPLTPGGLTLTGSSTSEEDCGVEITVFGICCETPDVGPTADPTEVCLGDGYIVAGTGDGFVEYLWGGGLEDGGEVVQETAGTFIHTLIGFSDDGCSDTATVTVVVNPLPTVDAGADVTVCEGDEITLSGSGALTYEWTPTATDGVPFAPDAGVTTYTVNGTDMNNCSGEDDLVVTVIELPYVASAIVVDEYYGYDGSIDITVAGGSGDYTYSWSHGPITEDVTGLTAGVIYTVSIDDITIDPGLCSSTETYTLTRFIGLDGETISQLTAYPNPTNDLLTVSYNGQFNYEVSTLLGEVVAVGTAVDQEQLSMKDLANGTYIVKVTAGDDINYVQVVKQ